MSLRWPGHERASLHVGACMVIKRILAVLQGVIGAGIRRRPRGPARVEAPSVDGLDSVREGVAPADLPGHSPDLAVLPPVPVSPTGEEAAPAPAVAATQCPPAAPGTQKVPRKPRGRKKRSPAAAEPVTAGLPDRRDDAERDALSARVAALEARIAELATRKAAMEGAVLSFQLAQYEAVGDALENCLRLRLEYLRLQAARSGSDDDRRAERAAAADYEACHPSWGEAGEGLADLDEATQVELKQRYRAAAMRCHPDRVPEAEKNTAGALFQRVQQAYRSGDLVALRAICLEMGGEGSISGRAGGSAADGGDALRRLLSDLQDHAADLILAIQTRQLDPDYRKALQPDAWAEEFSEVRARLEEECAELARRIRDLSVA